jgi:hypothetical protein
MAKDGKKDTSPESDWIPPGYVEAVALARERGVDKVRGDLFDKRRQAFKLDKTQGGLHPIPPSYWLTDEAGRWLKGEYPSDGWLRHPFRVIVRVEDGPPPQPVTDEVYLPPFMVLMLAAVRHFNISEQCWPKKPELEQYFRAQKLPDGSPISSNQARCLATLCRPLAAMSGGNKRGV